MILNFLKDEPYLQGTLSAFAKDKKITEEEVLREPHLRDFLGVLSLSDRFRFLSLLVGAFPGQTAYRALLFAHFFTLSIADRLKAFSTIQQTGNAFLQFALLKEIFARFGAAALHPFLENLNQEALEEIFSQLSEDEKQKEKELLGILQRYHPAGGWKPSAELWNTILRMQSEFWANLPDEKWGGKTPFEYAQTEEGRKEILRWIYQNIGDPVWVRYYQMVLEYPRDRNRRWIEALERTGGLLNLFRKVEVSTSSEKKIGMPFFGGEKSSEKTSDWNHTPLEDWNGLSPAMLLAGGGPQEHQLLQEFLERAAAEVRDPGDAHAAEFFATWIEGTKKGRKSVRQVILEERKRLVDLREKMVGELSLPGELPQKKKKKKEKPRRR
ncbi:MAG: hypothetical protein V2G48_02730 [bacterium JZ-2024 1]